jgi:hypothetical protein
MPKYLSRTSYTAEGLEGRLKDGDSKRKQAMKRLVESVRGNWRLSNMPLMTTTFSTI